MAGFLRKKTKQDSTPTKPLPPVISSPPTPSNPPPLFARFATTAQTNNAAASQRIVSSPMALGGRKETMKGGSGMASTNSLIAGRDAEAARRRNQEQFQASHPSLNGAYYNNYSPSSPPQVAPFRATSVDKPLPSPITAAPAPLPAMNRRVTASRTQGPPPSLQPHTLNSARSRASLDVRDLEQKPLPHPGSVQAYYWQEPKSPPPTTYKFTPKTPPKRNGSVSTPTAPQIGKMQPFPPTAYGQQGLPTTDAGSFAGQSIPPPISNGPISRQDFRPQNANDARNGVPSNRISMVGSPQMQVQDLRGTPMSDRVVDLPPEFALFQEFSETLADPSNRLSTYQDSPPNTLKSTEQVPGTQQQRLSIYREPNRAQFKPQPSLPQLNNGIPQRASPPLPPPPPEDMGVSTSHANPTAILRSSYKDFHVPQGPTHPSVPNTTYNRPNNVIQHQSPQPPPNRSQNNTSSPPVPAGASFPANYLPSLQSRSQDATPLPGANSESYFQPRPLPPPFANNLQPQMGQTPSQSAQLPPQLRKSPTMHAATAPLKGKPRIFAAMEGVDNEFEQASNPEPSYSQPQQPQQQYQQLSPPQQSSSSFLPPPPQIPMNGQALHHQHEQPQELLPSVEFFSTPKSQLDPLPGEFENGNHSFQSDPRSSSAYGTPPSPKTSFMPSLPLADAVLRSLPPRSNGRPRSRSGDDDVSRQQQPHTQPPLPASAQPSTPSRSRKLSKSRGHVDNVSIHSHPNGSVTTLPSTPESYTSKIHQHAGHKFISKPHPPTPMSPPKQPSAQLDEAIIMNAGIPLDDDPFARTEGVTMLKPTTPPPPKEGSIKRHRTKESKESSRALSAENGFEDVRKVESAGSSEEAGQVAGSQKTNGAIPLTPVSPEDYRQWRREHKNSSKSAVVPPPVPVVDRIFNHQDAAPREPFTLTKFVSDPQLLSSLLAFLTFYDWCILSSVSREIRILFVRMPLLREAILESYLKTIGYTRWLWDDLEPLSLSLQDLSDYMRGVSTPTHEYARVAAMHVHSLTVHPNLRDPSLADTVRSLTCSTRAYSRVVLRLRAQAEKEAAVHAAAQNQPPPPPSSTPSLIKGGSNFSPSRGTNSRVSSRAPSPTSMYSYTVQGNSQPPTSLYPSHSQSSLTFRSPLFRLRRAPLLRVFIPSPEGDWLSDKSVLECEAECKRAGIGSLMRLGDVVWDVAVGDEGNVGRLVWDGSYLIDLDYTYSTIGDLPKYLPTLAFPPSYFHRVIRTGAQTTNPVVHIDISPWGEEIALNLQLLQDRVRTETPQGAYHNVVRWVHRSSFTLRPSRGLPRFSTSARSSPANGRIPIPDSNNLFVDSGWYGTIVVETEGTNEALADLQDRCGPGAFPPRPKGPSARVTQAQVENRKVFRILRERSRPGEIWIRAVSVKERLL